MKNHFIQIKWNQTNKNIIIWVIKIVDIVTVSNHFIIQTNYKGGESTFVIEVKENEQNGKTYELFRLSLFDCVGTFYITTETTLSNKNYFQFIFDKTHVDINWPFLTKEESIIDEKKNYSKFLINEKWEICNKENKNDDSDFFEKSINEAKILFNINKKIDNKNQFNNCNERYKYDHIATRFNKMGCFGNITEGMMRMVFEQFANFNQKA